jgi:hypothetical protein
MPSHAEHIRDLQQALGPSICTTGRLVSHTEAESGWVVVRPIYRRRGGRRGRTRRRDSWPRCGCPSAGTVLRIDLVPPSPAPNFSPALSGHLRSMLPSIHPHPRVPETRYFRSAVSIDFTIRICWCHTMKLDDDPSVEGAADVSVRGCVP